MADRTLKRYTAGEEIFNSVSHGVGSLLAIGGTALMTVMSVAHGSGLAFDLRNLSDCALHHVNGVSRSSQSESKRNPEDFRSYIDLPFNCGELYAVLSGGPRRKQQGTCGNHRSMGLCNSGHRAQRHRSEKDREVWYGTLCHHGMVDFGCVQGHHPCSAGTGILAASHRRHQLYRRFGILRLEERKIHAQHLAFICPGGQRAPLSVHFHLRFAYGLLILPTK